MNTKIWNKPLEHVLRTRSQLKRLDCGIKSAAPRIEARLCLLSKNPPQIPEGVECQVAREALSMAKKLLDDATEALGAADPDLGWAQLHTALEAEVLAYHESEVDAAAVALRSELAGGYLTGTHASTIGNLLDALSASTEPAHRAVGGGSVDTSGVGTGPAGPEPQLGPKRRILLRRALEERNEFFENLYYAIRLSAHRRILLLIMGIAILGGAFYLLRHAPESDAISDVDFAAASASVAGMLGAVTSAIQRLAVNPSATIPAELDSLTATLTRPFIGVVGALTTYFAYRSGFFDLSTEAPLAMLLLISFGVGFTERLVVYNPQQAK